MNIGQNLLYRKRNSSPAFIPDLLFNTVCGCILLADDKIKQRIFESQENVYSADFPLILGAERVTGRAVEPQNVKRNTKDSMNWSNNGKIFLNI